MTNTTSVALGEAAVNHDQWDITRDLRIALLPRCNEDTSSEILQLNATHNESQAKRQ